MNDPTSEELFDIYESQYARDLEGRLIRIEEATQQDLQTFLTVTVDGKKVQVPKATPATDDQGNLLLDAEGRLVPRLTTVYDAASAAYMPNPTEAEPVPAGRNPIPVLCHQHHVKPVGVCRVCSVLTSRKGKAGGRLVPACQHPVVGGMEVHTVASQEEVSLPGVKEPQIAGEHVRKTVKVLVELLAANHLHQDQPDGERKYQNELLEMSRRFEIPVATRDGLVEPQTPFRRRTLDPDRQDTSSPVIAVDHNQCILCDRCVRACSDVKPFKIIGHTGFGSNARISFDLDEPMGESGCVSCGECAVACPTGALTFKGTIYGTRDPWGDMAAPRPTTLKAEELHTLPLFSGVPFAYLRWNEGAVGRLRCTPGLVLCRKGEYGASAFLIEEGEVEVDTGHGGEPFVFSGGPGVILGEMACMTHQPRNATVRARTAANVLVIRRNMLHMLQRNRTARLILHPTYRRRALATYLSSGKLFSGLSAEESQRCKDFLGGLKDGVEFLQVDPEQVIMRQGTRADDFFIIYLGNVEVAQTNEFGRRQIVGKLGAGQHFGEIGLMSNLFPSVAALLPESQRGRRTATCTALDHVELVRVHRDAFVELLARIPALRDRLERICRGILGEDQRHGEKVGNQLDEYVATGLYQGKSLLVLDLEKCTRCQECVKGCADSHGGVTRLILDGNRIDKYLVPSACRSCQDPFCLVGCPVDAIHRRPSDPKRPAVKGQAIVIEDHCIGCGLCAHNCPYGSIHMAPRTSTSSSARRVATNCDLCESLDGNPRCVHHCPHEAAIRLDGDTFAHRIGIHLGPKRQETSA